MTEDYYALLGVEPDAREEAILRAYREGVSEHHPDVSDAEDAEETFRRLNRAKDVLTDEERRREYDSLGHQEFLERVGDDGSDSTAPANGPETEAGFPGRPDRNPDAVSAGAASGGVPWRTRGWPVDMGGLFGSPAHLDWRSLLLTTGPHAGRQDGPGVDQPSTEEAVECPRCRGRGRFVHELDTARGRRRRVEPCERCGGAGIVAR